MTDVKVFCVGPIATNCYLITDLDTGAMAVVDPGYRSDALVELINSKGSDLKYIILTHGHFDHISFAKELARGFKAEILCSFETQPFLRDNSLNLSAFHPEVEDVEPFDGDAFVKDGDTFNLGSTAIKYISTPGHTNDSGCYIFDNAIISGDTLFCESYGRTDFSTSSFDDMIKSIKRLKELKGDYTVYPGHGSFTTLEHERKYNPLMRRL